MVILTRLLPEGWRRAHQSLAWLGGYFWLPCLRCRRPWGGHEARGRLFTCVTESGQSWHAGNVICPRCTRELSG